MIDATRHINIFNPGTFHLHVFVIGCGGMGSRIAEALVRMGIGERSEARLYLYDPDVYEPHNVANQFVDHDGVGQHKVSALRRRLLAINPHACIVDRPLEVKAQVALSGVVFLCVDSMSARRVIMERLLESRSAVRCVIETRMDAYVGISHCFNPNISKHCDCWWLYWHSDEESDAIVGCNGHVSIISAILGTTMLALKQFESFARAGTTTAAPNRIYQDFDGFRLNYETWPTT